MRGALRPFVCFAASALLLADDTSAGIRHARVDAALAESVCIEVLATRWQHRFGDTRSVTETLKVVAREGIEFGLAPKPRARSHPWATREPFRVLRIVAPDRAWVATDLCSGAPIGGHAEGETLDSVLVSTSWRSLHTDSFDAGEYYRLRVVPDSRLGKAVERPAKISIVQRKSAGMPSFEQYARTSRLVGVFRLLSVRPAERPAYLTSDVPTNSHLLLRACEIWKGESIQPGDTLTEIATGCVGAPGAWAPNDRTMPVRIGDRLVLFLRPDTETASRRAPTFDERFGRAYVDSTTERVYNGVALRSTLARLHLDVDRACEPLRRAWRGRVVGRVVSDDSLSRGLPGRVMLQRNRRNATVDSAGRFTFEDVPIGLDMLRFRGPGGTGCAIVEVSDEHSDSIEVRIQRR